MKSHLCQDQTISDYKEDDKPYPTWISEVLCMWPYHQSRFYQWANPADAGGLDFKGCLLYTSIIWPKIMRCWQSVKYTKLMIVSDAIKSDADYQQQCNWQIALSYLTIMKAKQQWSGRNSRGNSIFSGSFLGFLDVSVSIECSTSNANKPYCCLLYTSRCV